MALGGPSLVLRLRSQRVLRQFLNNPRGEKGVPKMGEDLWARIVKKTHFGCFRGLLFSSWRVRAPNPGLLRAFYLSQVRLINASFFGFRTH